jgi:hypothetical protein
VVPDPSTRQEAVSASGRGATSIAGTAAMSCPTRMVYISDHSASNGAGRSQLTQILDRTTPVMLAAGESLLFDLAPGVQVMCARVSVYWLAAPAGSPVPWLHRTDVQPAVAPAALVGASGRVYVSAVPAGADLVAPGVHDMQLAYAFSSELPGLGRAATPAQR